jgi:hypothetical protein
MDFFTVITANFRILYCLFLIRHSRREIIHFNATEHPTSEWVVQQLREAFPETTEDQYLIFDRDAKFGTDVRQVLDSSGICAIHTSYRSPWQKDYASHCTSWVPCATTWFARRRLDSFTPCAFRGGLLPGCSNRQSFLSL